MPVNNRPDAEGSGAEKAGPMTRENPGIRFIEGRGDILLIAPHGPVVGGMPRNDENTGLLVERIGRRISRAAIINDEYLKPDAGSGVSLRNRRLDFNKARQARKHPLFMEWLRRVIHGPGLTTVVWIHGLSDRNALGEERKHRQSDGAKGARRELHALIGYGQGRDLWEGTGESRYTASHAVVRRLVDLLGENGMTARVTRDNAPNYRGRHPGRMNQWFLEQGYGLDRVQSIQIEIRRSGFRDTPENIDRAAKNISSALLCLLGSRPSGGAGEGGNPRVHDGNGLSVYPPGNEKQFP